VVIGGGAAGTLTAVRLADEAGRRHRALDITIVEPRDVLGGGVAYSTDDSRHLLNVPARSMSAYPEDGDHFVRWLVASDGGPVDPCAFVSRGRYGRYLGHVLDQARRRTPWVTVVHRKARAVDLHTVGRRCRVHLDCGDELVADAVVLAVGHLGPELSWVPARLQASERFVADPWAPGTLDDIDPAGDVLVVGTGLTMVDTVRALDRPGRTVHAVSRHGVIPHRHVAGALPAMEAPELGPTPPTLAELHDILAAHVAKSVARHGDWRPAIDSIRTLTPALWAGLSDTDRAEFVALDARQWEAARHRVPPASADAVDAARAAGRLVLRRASVSDAAETDSGLEVTLSDGSTVHVAAVVNCAGPCSTPATSTDPLIQSLLGQGLARGGPLGIGLDTASDGRLRDATGDVSVPVWTLGSLRRGTLWESTAMPEIRQQAAALAKAVLGPAATRDDRPVDQWGLGLSTSPEAADAWCHGLQAIATLQRGADAALREAVAADPGFAIAHATLALVGHEWGTGVDVDASLRAAVETAARRADERERSFVQVVSTRLTAASAAADRDLRRHLREHPRDALAVSMALPTIAFSGLTGPVAESWALAERLAPSYGDDWWFAGMLAFVRQEQERWDDAERLSVRSLREEPAAGHAVHARTHVFYETGSHRDGLAWLDGWITGDGAANEYRAHFSWHAAMHELAVDDVAAARARYDTQLAPRHVAGARALVDSASMLWRSSLGGQWPGDVPIGEVLATVPSCLLDHPATAFAAMHAVIGLAAAGDADAIGRLRSFAAGHADPTYGEVIVPMCDGFAAYVRGEPSVAARHLAGAETGAGRLGGSAAQQEVIAETRLQALIDAGEHDEARRVLEARLDRRPRPSETRRIATLR
jgi:uncharacterized NAD(P)/FAD-binding protein YdhS